MWDRRREKRGRRRRGRGVRRPLLPTCCRCVRGIAHCPIKVPPAQHTQNAHRGRSGTHSCRASVCISLSLSLSLSALPSVSVCTLTTRCGGLNRCRCQLPELGFLIRVTPLLDLLFSPDRNDFSMVLDLHSNVI